MDISLTTTKVKYVMLFTFLRYSFFSLFFTLKAPALHSVILYVLLCDSFLSLCGYVFHTEHFFHSAQLCFLLYGSALFTLSSFFTLISFVHSAPFRSMIVSALWLLRFTLRLWLFTLLLCFSCCECFLSICGVPLLYGSYFHFQLFFSLSALFFNSMVGRFSLHGSRFSLHGSWFLVSLTVLVSLYGSWFSLHRFGFHG